MIPFRIYNGFFDDKNQSKYESIEVFVQLSFSKKKIVPDLKTFSGL